MKNMERINNLLRELKRCEYAHLLYEAPSTYNGFSETQGLEGYSKYLSILFDHAEDALSQLSDSQKTTYRQRLQEIKQEQELFDVPSKETLAAINAELQANRNAELRQERDFILFVRGCVSLQKDYTNRFLKHFIPSDKSPNSTDEVETPLIPLIQEEESKQDSEWAFGYKEISETFHWGRNKTHNFLKNPKYAAAIQRDGRKIAVNIPKARELMQLSNNKQITKI